VLLILAGCGPSAEMEQPIAYKHKIHVAMLDIPCTDCHVGAEMADHATLPSRDKCLECHRQPLGESPEEARLLEILATGEPIPWRRVTRVAEHVHFSHRRHVVAGGIICETCHGQVTEMEEPFTKPFISFARETGMERCIACHLASGNPRASVDCALCHR
jgi:c(7)-type cytochrome triheme protein